MPTAAPFQASESGAALPAARGWWICVVATALLLSAVLLESAEPARLWAASGMGGLVALWLLAAYGYGAVACRLLLPEVRSSGDARHGPLTLALGIAALLAIDSALASAGFFAVGRAWLAAVPLAVGALPAVALICRSWSAAPSAWLAVRPHAAWLALPALAAFAIAAVVPAGMLWSSEFGGYDALSYHLLVPREWLQQGSASPLQHNVYSAFPGFMESATLQLFAAAGWQDVRATGVAAQMLHSVLAISAAWSIGAAAAGAMPTASARTRSVAHAAAWCFVLGIPWVLVVGSSAYNEMGMLACGAGALLAWQCAGSSGGWRCGAALGLLVGAAVGCKLTAVGMIALPLLAWAACTWPARPAWRRLASLLVAAALAAAAVLAPWMIRNALASATTGGNPFFPFASSLFGTGWWSAEQADRFLSAHSAHGGLMERLRELWYQGPAYGLAASPYTGEPWLPQWSVAWWVAAGALGALAFTRCRRTALAAGACLAAQLAFWLLATHMKSRFLLPCVLPMGIGVGVGVAVLWNAAEERLGDAGAGNRPAGRARAVHIACAAAGCATLVLWCTQPLNLLWYDTQPRGGRPGDPQRPSTLRVCAENGFDGLLMCAGPPDIATAASDPSRPIPVVWALNHAISPRALVATEGEAALFWCNRVPLYGTVWDGGPLAQELRETADAPAELIKDFRRLGVTHLVLNDAMLDRWNRSGWLDPAVTPGRVQSIRSRLRPVRALQTGGVLYEFP